MAVNVGQAVIATLKAERELGVVEARQLFTGEQTDALLYNGGLFFQSSDVTSHGQRFVVARKVGSVSRSTITVVQNWISEFEGRE